jgi:transposase
MAERVAVIGAALWTKRLASVLANYGCMRCSPVSEIRARDCWNLLWLPGARYLLRVGFRPGQFRPRGLVIDLVSALYVGFGGKMVFYWTGSDVQRTLSLYRQGESFSTRWGRAVSRFLMNRARHCAAAPWLVDELDSIGVSAVCRPFPTPTEEFEPLIHTRDDQALPFRVLTYIPDHNFENYCGSEMVEVARLLPNVQFAVMGGSGSWCAEPPANIKFLGWTNAAEQYVQAAVVVRAVRHDALGGTVREALLCGCHVIYTFPHEHTEQLELLDCVEDTARHLAGMIADLEKRFSVGELPSNGQGRQWVMDHLGEEKLSADLVGYLRDR